MEATNQSYGADAVYTSEPCADGGNQTVMDSAPVLSDVSDRPVSVGSSSVACCSLPQCDTCLALLRSQQNPLAPISTSFVNSARSQLDNASHTSSQTINKSVFNQSPAYSNTLGDVQRKISVVSNQSTMSTDSDYVSDTNNLYLDNHARKLSDVQNFYETYNAELSNYTKPASYNLTLNLTNTYKSTVKDQSCQTPGYPPDCVDFKNEVKLSDIHKMQSPVLERGENWNDPKRKISNISTISTLSSLSAESSSTFDTITLGPDTASADDFCVVDCCKQADSLPKASQVSRLLTQLRWYEWFFSLKFILQFVFKHRCMISYRADERYTLFPSFTVFSRFYSFSAIW